MNRCRCFHPPRREMLFAVLLALSAALVTASVALFVAVSLVA